MGIQSQKAFEEAFKLIEICDFGKALRLLNDALTADLENEDLVFAIRSCNFWIDAVQSLSQQSCFEQGESLLSQWKQFLTGIVDKTDSPLEKTVYSFTKGIFSFALELYSRSEEEKDVCLKSEKLRKIGLCYKKLGSYEVALKYLTDANVTLNGQASIVAEMADCYALCGETKNAKMLFKEAFYIDASKIDLVFLDSPLITVLIRKVESLGVSGVALQEWVAVYGVIFGVFNVKRSLTTHEVLRLKQEVYAKENELKDPSNNKELIKPRLMNLYFWLIDYYVLAKESVSKINEVLLKMKILDPEIHKLYIN